MLLKEGFYAFSGRYLPYTDSAVSRSRGQIFSIRRKCYASDKALMSCKGFDELSARYTSHIDSSVSRSRGQMFSVWGKCNAVHIRKVLCESD